MDDTKNTILVVAPSAENRKVLAEAFSSEYNIVEADSGAEAITYLNHAAMLPGLVLADYQMPAINGLELLSALKESTTFLHIPFILVMDTYEEDITDAAFAAGADEILVRPFQTALLKKRVHNITELHPPVFFENMMEKLVTNEVDRCIGKLDLCQCLICRNDLIALTLNHMPPKYVNTDKGAALSKVETLSAGSQATIIARITSAAEIVRKYPRHKK